MPRVMLLLFYSLFILGNVSHTLREYKLPPVMSVRHEKMLEPCLQKFFGGAAEIFVVGGILIFWLVRATRKVLEP